MCGIAGMVNLGKESVSPVLLKKMTDSIVHRGPDGEGQWINKNVGIGHRRLAILDLSPAGHQPMISQNGKFVLSYNGEIYNFREIRAQLESCGYQFRSNSDTEVVLTSLIEWGIDALQKFNGMFALAFFDIENRELFLARDRYGIKPLYYASQNNIFTFGSEQKAILTLPKFERDLNKSALLEYFTFQNIFTEQTLVEDVYTLPSGSFMVINTETGITTITKYWDYDFEEPNKKIAEKDYVENLDFLFQQAVNRQLISDVEVGGYLSGGMDSGAITAIASQSISGLKTFTCGFDLSSASGIELTFDERQKAEAMSAKFKTEHYEIVLKAGDMERCLPTMAYHLEEPRVGQSYPNFYAAKLASKFVKVVLAGSGGDELFGGYPWRYYRAANAKDFENYIDQYYRYWQRLVENRHLKKIFSPIWTDVKHILTRDIFRDVFVSHRTIPSCPEDYINYSLYFEAKTFLHGLFSVEDKLSMSHGLETRVPFMDNDLVDFAMSCPVNLKLNNLTNVLRINENEIGSKQNQYFKKTNDGKSILRKMMSRYIPREIVEAQKQGFSSPDASWFQGESIDFVKRIVFDEKSLIYNYLDPIPIKKLVSEHLSGENNRRLFIWSLISIEKYLQTDW
ncbi:MAG: asparagine synthase (glutamine-hydrolyzing) [Proteobacteria bacterium]|nr:asparagine synthase (glutamine-hydrolyzing) [Pseudomonadota bacterium]